MKNSLLTKGIKQFISYFYVGGVAAIVEWTAFLLLEHLFGLQYLWATVLVFMVSTTVSWILGRCFTFKDSAYQEKRVRELVLVFFVSAIGLVFNMLLMILFVDYLEMRTNLLKMTAKILATGIVFIWNFLARKMFIYRV